MKRISQTAHSRGQFKSVSSFERILLIGYQNQTNNCMLIRHISKVRGPIIAALVLSSSNGRVVNLKAFIERLSKDIWP